MLGADGVVQYFDAFRRPANPNFAKDLPEQLDRLLAGKDVYPTWFEALRRAAAEHYQRGVEAAAKGRPTVGRR